MQLTNGNNAHFDFRQRRERVDWKKLASLDVDKVARDVDFEALQENTANVTFCDIQAELDPNKLDPNFVKLFRLAQLIIEYLLYSQDCLSTTLSSLEQKLVEVTKQCEEQKEKLDKAKAKCKKMDSSAPVIIFGEGNQNQCSVCSKMFISEKYLKLHIERRHPDNNRKSDKMDENGAKLVLEKELSEIKERLKSTEAKFQQEKEALQKTALLNEIECAKKETELKCEMESWKTSQLENHQRQLDSVRDMFLAELRAVNEKYNASEQQLRHLEDKIGPKSNLGAMIDDEEEISMELVKRQQQEMELLKEQLSKQMAQVGSGVKSAVKEQEKLWKAKLRQLEDEHNQEILELKDLLQRRIEDSSNERSKLSTEANLRQRLQELEKVNRVQKRKLKQKEEAAFDTMELSPVRFHSTPNPILAEALERSTNVAGETLTSSNSEPSLQTTNGDIDENSREYLGSDVRNNPLIVKGMREEVVSLLDEKLESIGVSKNTSRMKDSTLSSVLATQKSGRTRLTKKYKSLLTLRDQLQKKVDRIASLKLGEANPNTPTGSKRSFGKLLKKVKEKITTVRAPSPALVTVTKSPSRPLPVVKTGTAESTKHERRETSLMYADDDDDDVTSGSDSSDKEVDEVAKQPLGSDSDFDDQSDADSFKNVLLSTNSLNLAGNGETPPRPPPRKAVPFRSPSVPELTSSLEIKLKQKRAEKPIGGVDVMPSSNGWTLSTVSTEDLSNTAASSQVKMQTSTGALDLESSSTSKWVSSGGSKQPQSQVAEKRQAATSGHSSSLVSVSSWDDDDDSDIA